MTSREKNKKSKAGDRLRPKEMLLSENMIEILRMLNEFGFCDISHIGKRFDVKKTIAYENMQILINYRLVMHTRLLKYQPRVYYLTSKGIDLLKLDLPLIRRIPLNIYAHQLTVIDVYLKLRKIYPNAIWVSERRLIREKYSSNSKMNDHLPDGALVFPEGYQCAIEVERSLKTRDRLSAILNEYGLQTTYREVWYFCTTGIITTLSELAIDAPYIKIYNLSEFLI